SALSPKEDKQRIVSTSLLRGKSGHTHCSNSFVIRLPRRCAQQPLMPVIGYLNGAHGAYRARPAPEQARPAWSYFHLSGPLPIPMRFARGALGGISSRRGCAWWQLATIPRGHQEGVVPKPTRRRILVTGATGLIGSELCGQLTERCHAVIALVHSR